MSLCAICGKLLSSSESGRRPCCQARVHSKCIQGYSEYCHNSGNPNPSCPVCKQQAEDLQSKNVRSDSLLNALRKSSNSSSSGEGVANNLNCTRATALSSPKSPRVAQAEALIQKAEKRSAEKERQVVDAERQIAEEQARLTRRNVAGRERSTSPSSESQTTAAFKKTISILEERVTNMTAEANQKQADFDKRLMHEVSLRKELEQNFNSLADYSAQLQNQEKELSTLLEVEQNEHAACKSNLSTIQSQVSLLTSQVEQLQKENVANEALFSSTQGLSQQTEQYFHHQIEDLSYSLAATRESLEDANNELSRALEAQKYYENRCGKLESLNEEFKHHISELNRSQELLDSTKSEVDSELSQLKDNYLELQGQLAEARQEIMTLRDSNDESGSELEHLRKANEQLEHLNSELNGRVSHIQTELDQARSYSQQLSEQNAAWTRDKDHIQQLEMTLRDLKEQYQTKCHELEAVEARIAKISGQQSSRIGLLETELESLQEKLQRSEEQCEESLSKQRDLFNELQSAKLDRTKLESLLETTEMTREDNGRLKVELDTLRSSYKELDERHSQLLDNQSSSLTEIAELLEREQNLEGQLSSLKQELADSENRFQLAATKEHNFAQRLSVLTESLKDAEENHRSAVLANTELEQRLDDSILQNEKSQEALQSAAEVLRAKVFDAESEIEDLSRANEELNLRISEFQNLQKAKNDLEQELHVISESLLDSEQQRTALSDEIIQLQEERDLSLVQHEERLEQLQAELNEARLSKKAAERDNELFKTTIEELRSDLEAVREEAKKESENSELLNSQLVDKIEGLHEEIAKMTEKSRAEEDRLQTSLNESLDNLEGSLQKLSLNEAELLEVKDEVSRLSSALEDVCAKLNESDMVAAERSAECHQLKQQISGLTAKFSGFVSEHDKLSRDNAKLLHMFEQSEKEQQGLKDQLLQEHRRQKQISELFARSLSAHRIEFQSAQDELTSVKSLLARSFEERSQFADQARSIEELMPIVESQRAEMNKLQNDYSRVCALLEAMEDTKSDHDQQMGAIVEQLKNKDTELDDLRVENSTLRSTIAEFRDQAEKDHKEHADQQSALQAELKQIESERAQLLVLSQVQKKLPISRSASNKPSRDASPALSRAFTAATSNTGPILSRVSTAVTSSAEPMLSLASTAVTSLAEPILSQPSTVAASDPTLLLDGAPTSNADSSMNPTSSAIDDEMSNNAETNSVPKSVFSSRTISPALSRNSSRARSSSRSPSVEPPAAPAPVPPPAIRPLGPVRPMRMPMRPVPARRMGPPVRRALSPAAVDAKPPVVSVSPEDASDVRAVKDVEAMDNDVENLTSNPQRPPSPVAVAQAPISVPARPSSQPLPFRGTPGRPMSFRPQPMRRGPPGPNRLPLPFGAGPPSSSSDHNGSGPSPSGSNPNRSDSPPSPAQITMSSPRSTVISRQVSSSSINMSDAAKEQDAGESSRSESQDTAASPPLMRPNPAIPTGPATRLAPPARPVPGPIRRMPPGPHRPGRSAGLPAPAVRPSPAPASPRSSAGDSSVSSKSGESDFKPVEEDCKPPNESGRPYTIRSIPSRPGMVARRSVPPSGHRFANIPPPSRVDIVSSGSGRNSINKPPPSASSVMLIDAKSPENARSRSSSPKPSSPAQDGVLGRDQDVSVTSAPPLENSHRSQSAQIRSRNVPSKSPPRSNSLLKKLLSSGPDENEVEKVDFVFDRRSGSWVPEGTIEPDNDPASNALNTVQRLRSQVHQTREEISNANAELPESKRLATDQPGIPEGKWIEACELLRESRLRFPTDDLLRIRIDRFLVDAGSGVASLPDAVSELEDLLQTVQTHDEKSRGSSGRFFSMFVLLSVLIAVATSVFYSFYPEQANQAFENLSNFAFRVITKIQSAQTGNNDINDDDDSDRIEL